MTGRVRVEMRRSGGFTGRPLQVRLDSAQMPPAEALRLRELLSTLDLSGPAAGPTPMPTAGPTSTPTAGPTSTPTAEPSPMPTVGADLMRYELTVDHDGGHWSATYADPTIPAALRPLLQFLVAAARAS
jgi:hypothetical protein